jgi:outer membrane protein, heavy metal efflux system
VQLSFLAICWIASVSSPSHVSSPSQVSEVEFSLERCREMALAGNPILLAAEADVRAAAGDLDQARARSNPDLSIEIEDFGGEIRGFTESAATLSLARRFGPLGLRGARIESARQDRAIAESERNRARRDLVAEVDRRHATLLLTQARLDILRGAVFLADSLVAAVEALAVAGEVSPIEIDRARAERMLAEIEAARASSSLRQAQAAIGSLWNEREPERIRATGSLEVPPSLPDQAVLDDPANLPEIERADAEIARNAALARIERRSRIPALDLSAGVRRYSASQTRTFVASAGIELPILDRNGGSIAAAKARLDRSRFERRSLESALRGARIAAYEALRAGLVEVELLRGRVLADMDSAARATREGYRLGEFRLTDVLDAGRTLKSARLRHVEALGAVALLKIDLEQQLGRPLEPPAESISPDEIKGDKR